MATQPDDSHRRSLEDKFPFQAYIDGAEHRAITIPQLKGVAEYALAHCSCWTTLGGLIPRADAVNLYDVNTWMIQPATLRCDCSFVELLAGLCQDPLWFVSHWWGEAIVDFLKCLVLHLATRKIGHDSAYWICAYANRQHSLGQDVAADPTQTSFFKALMLAGGVVLVLDDKTDKSGPATPFTRVWCVFEESVALNSAAQAGRAEPMKLDIAACSEGTAYLITDGVAEADTKHVFPRKAKTEREGAFPLAVVKQGLCTRVELAKASVEMDRAHILNCIADRDLELLPPLDAHANYDKVNRQLRSMFSLAVWRLAVDRDMVEELRLPEVLADDNVRESAFFDFTDCVAFDFAAALAFARGLPRSLRHLEAAFRDCQKLGNGGLAALAEGIPPSLTTLVLNFTACPQVGDGGVAALARMLPAGLSVLKLFFWGADSLSDAGLAALAQGLPRGLRQLKLVLNHCPNITDDGIASVATALPVASLERLRLFILRGTVGDPGVVTLAEAIKGAARLTNLRLRITECVGVTDASVVALADALPVSLTALEIALQGTSTSDSAREASASPAALHRWRDEESTRALRDVIAARPQTAPAAPASPVADLFAEAEEELVFTPKNPQGLHTKPAGRKKMGSF